MKFWDTSALVPLLVRETETAKRTAQLEADPEVVVFAYTAVEITSALARQTRAGLLATDVRAVAEARFATLRESWTEISSFAALRTEALRLVTTHDLQTLDALQLAATLTARRELGLRELLTSDQKLATAARAEGFEVG